MNPDPPEGKGENAPFCQSRQREVFDDEMGKLDECEDEDEVEE